LPLSTFGNPGSLPPGIAAIAASPTGATEAGNTVTITTTAAHGFSVGQSVVIAGVAVAGYNGTFVIASVPTPTTFTYTNPTAGLAASGGGTATVSFASTLLAGSFSNVSVNGFKLQSNFESLT